MRAVYLVKFDSVNAALYSSGSNREWYIAGLREKREGMDKNEARDAGSICRIE